MGDGLSTLGHQVSTVAGEGVADVILPGLAIDAATPPSHDQLADALADADLVVVENLASLPLNLAARDVLYHVLEGRRALFHHHDLAWQRPHLAHLEGPRTDPLWRHVTINELSRELHERGIEAERSTTLSTAIRLEGIGVNTRHDGLDDERLVVMPSRASGSQERRRRDRNSVVNLKRSLVARTERRRL